MKPADCTSKSVDDTDIFHFQDSWCLGVLRTAHRYHGFPILELSVWLLRTCTETRRVLNRLTQSRSWKLRNGISAEKSRSQPGASAISKRSQLPFSVRLISFGRILPRASEHPRNARDMSTINPAGRVRTLGSTSNT